jgi:hypothetical protein
MSIAVALTYSTSTNLELSDLSKYHHLNTDCQFIGMSKLLITSNLCLKLWKTLKY